MLPRDREKWREIVQSVTQKYCESRKEKVIKQREEKCERKNKLSEDRTSIHLGSKEFSSPETSCCDWRGVMIRGE